MADSVDEIRDAHPIFETDPERYMDFVYKEVCVLTADGASHSGRCYTVDPVSQSVVLVKLGEGEAQTQLKLIMGHCVQNIVVLDENTEKYKAKLDMLFNNDTQGELSAEIEQKKAKLIAWLLKNCIPVEVHGDVLSISNALFIDPPYGPRNCRSTNEIILGKVQGLIQNMPKDISEW